MSTACIELEFVVDGTHADTWSDALMAAGGVLSVSAEDAIDGGIEQAIFGEPGEPPPPSSWPRTRLRVLLAPAADPVRGVDTLLRHTAAEIGVPVPQHPSTRRLDEQDWVGQSQAQFAPIEIGPRLRISPSWAPPAASERERTIVLDPGLAFGTGSHPTTRMCLRWIERALPAGAHVIDYGCGSGILAIASARLGASPVTAIDIDEQALAATARNAQANGVTLAVRSSRDAPPPAADVVLANILANPLKILAPMLESLLLPGGTLILAGLLERQIDEVASCYPNCTITVEEIDEGWACLRGTRLQ